MWLSLLPHFIRNRIEGRHYLQKIIGNTGWLFFDKALRTCVGFLVGVWVTRYLGPEQFGLLSYAQSFVFLFSAIATFGLDSVVIRELLKNEAKRDVLLGTAFVLKLIGATIVLPLLGIAIQFTRNDTFTNYLVFLIASAAIFQSFNVIDFYFQSKVLSKYVVWANTVAMIISSAVKIALIIYKAPLMAFAVVALFDALVLAAGLIISYLYTGLRLRSWQFEKRMAQKLLKDSWPLIVSGIVVSLAMRIDQVMLQNMLGAKEVGIYAAAVRLAEPLNFIGFSVVQSVFPYIVSADNNDRFKTNFIGCIRYTSLILVVISLLITYLSGSIVLVVYGVSYFRSSIPLAILVWTVPLVFLSLISNAYYLKTNQTKIIAYRQIILFIFNISLNVILIKYYGVIGAAISKLLGDFLLAFIVEIFSKSTRFIFYLKIKALFFIPVTCEEPR